MPPRAGARGFLLRAVVFALVGLFPALGLAQSTTTPTTSPTPPPPTAPSGERPGPAPAPPPGSTTPAQPAERPPIERPSVPTERVPPAPAVQPRPADVAPTAPGPTVPSVAAPVLPAAAGGLPAGAVFEIHPSARLSEEYSDNFSQTSRDRRDNFRTALSPGLTVFLNSPFTKGTLTYNFSLTHDSSAGSADPGQFHSLAGTVAWEATPLLTVSLAETLTRSDEPSQADRLSLRRQRTPFTSNTFAADLTYRLRLHEIHPYYRYSTFTQEQSETRSHTAGVTTGISLYSTNRLTLGYEYLSSTTSGSPTTSDAGDISGHQLTASLSRQINRQITAGITTGYALRRESRSSLGQDEFRIWNVALFNSYTLPGRLTLDGSIGVSVLTDDRGREGTSLSTTSTLSYRFAKATAVLSADRGFSETFSLGENFGVVDTQGVTASLSYGFSPALSASVNGFYRQNEFTGVAGGDANRKETTWGASTFVSLRLRPWLEVGLQYSFTERTDRDDSGSFTENRAQTFLNASF